MICKKGARSIRSKTPLHEQGGTGYTRLRQVRALIASKFGVGFGVLFYNRAQLYII